MSDLIRIDGSYGEGGGQVLRTSLSLSAITGRPIEIVNIRGGRPKPGLQPQHLAAVRAAAQICGASLKGDALGSLYLLFDPHSLPAPGEYRFDIGTAGATTLVAQTVMVPLGLAPQSSAVTVTGGTHNPLAPTADYLEHVYAATSREIGYSFRTAYGPPGFFPKGGGELRIEIESSQIRRPILFDERDPSGLQAHIVTCSLPAKVSKRAEDVLREGMDVRVVARVEEGVSIGAAVTITSAHAGFTALGARGKPMERVTQEAISDAVSWLEGNASVDEHLADQLVLPALFAGGENRWSTPRVTEHLRTVIWVAKHFLDFEASIDDETGRVVLRS
ncbi:MAG TPA: RNA 3'-terminal phosphate cyclase [Fimbriimonadaceae bacterium]|nr:RNA 3'-terminal phosphate cyclase [Fimbriimonadaceae bacterium]